MTDYKYTVAGVRHIELVTLPELQIVREVEGPEGPSTEEMMRPFSIPWAMS